MIYVHNYNSRKMVQMIENYNIYLILHCILSTRSIAHNGKVEHEIDECLTLIII